MPAGLLPLIFQVHSDAIRIFYLVQLAIWMWTAFSCKWLEERRKDYLEMMAHHVVTVALVSNSYVENQVQTISLLHLGSISCGVAPWQIATKEKEEACLKACLWCMLVCVCWKGGLRCQQT